MNPNEYLGAPVPFDNLDIHDVFNPNGDDLWFPFPDLTGTGIVASDTRTITGKIVDQDGIGIPATLHSTNDNTIAAIADFDGNYSLTVPANHLIHISMVGQEAQQILAANILKITKLLPDNDNMLDVVDLGTIHPIDPLPPIDIPTGQAPTKVNWWFVGTGLAIVATLVAVSSKSTKKRKPALAGGKKKKKYFYKEFEKKKPTSKKRTSKKRTVKKKVAN